MPDPLITLTTDFGEDSPYVAAMKGVILGINPSTRILDLSHQIPPQDLRHTAFFLAEAIPYFPPGVIHVVVVDPGVGSERALLGVVVDGHRLLVPDNGCWTLLEGSGTSPTVIRLTDSRYWRHPLSATFHGRDILAPVAGHLSLGVDLHRMGPAVAEWVKIEMPPPLLGVDHLIGEVVFVDHFGNLITNIPAEAFLELTPRPVRITVGDCEVPARVRTYSEATPGSLIALISSAGMLEIAVVRGSAAKLTGQGCGSAVKVIAAGNSASA